MFLQQKVVIEKLWLEKHFIFNNSIVILNRKGFFNKIKLGKEDQNLISLNQYF